ncbi:hypothetical protein B0G84_3258 [Paraburkholderia sp. BL8N3]|nr:hypothetical protein [Paraburkholderia sp. BL8N3]TCK37958.1 hypothetical protein B0G84_3258 [Paraburkholderia sp. BL8N3]
MKLLKLYVTDLGRDSFETEAKRWPTLPRGSQHDPVTGTLNGRIFNFRRTKRKGQGNVPTFYGWFTINNQPYYFDCGTFFITHGVKVRTEAN